MLYLSPKAQSNIVSYVMLLAIGAVVGVSFYYIYAVSSAEVYTQTHVQRRTELERISSSLVLSLPTIIREGTDYYGTIYNSGNLFSEDLSVSIIRANGTTSRLEVLDENGNVVSRLARYGIGFFRISPLPRQGDVVFAGAKNVFTFYKFKDDILFVRDVAPNTPSIAYLDNTTISISIDECTPDNIFTWTLGIPQENINSIYLDGHISTNGNISYFVVESSNQTIYDTVSEATHVTYEATYFNYSNGVLSACIKNTERDPLLIDYLHAIVIYYGNASISDTTPPTASNGSPTGTINDDTPLLGVMTDENALCKGTIDTDESYEQMDFTFSGTALTHSYQVETPLGLGSHTVYVRCKDYYGNTMQTSYSWAFSINTTVPDHTPPDIILISPENKTYNSTTIELAYTVNEATEWCGYSLNNADNVTITGNTTFTAEYGSNKIVLYCNDSSGNIGYEKQWFSVQSYEHVESTPYYTFEDDGNWWGESITNAIDGNYLTADDYWRELPDWVQFYFPDMGVPTNADIQEVYFTFYHKEYIEGDQTLPDDWRHMIYCYDGTDWREIETYPVNTETWVNFTSVNFQSQCVPDNTHANEIKIKVTYDPASLVGSYQYVDWAKVDVYYVLG